MSDTENNVDMSNDEEEDQHMSSSSLLLDWSNQQRRILTANGKAPEYYQASRGFDFQEQELPHSYFGRPQDLNEFVKTSNNLQQQICPVVGVWNRPLFVGEWEHSTDCQELVYNVQTNVWFVDLRIPRWLHKIVGNATCYKDLTGLPLRLLARQHVFAGVTRCCNKDADTTAVQCPQGFVGHATRYHCMDWNYLGNVRNRPNKWWVELLSPWTEHKRMWKEYSFATNPAGQYYYWERWESAEGDDGEELESTLASTQTTTPVLAIQRCGPCQGLIVVVGDHFNYCCHNITDESLLQLCNDYQTPPQHAIDQAVEQGDLALARRILSRMHGGHGRIIHTNNQTTEWKIDWSTEPWKQGQVFWDRVQIITLSAGDTIDACRIRCNKDDEWTIVECNLKNVEELKQLLPCTDSKLL